MSKKFPIVFAFFVGVALLSQAAFAGRPVVGGADPVAEQIEQLGKESFAAVESLKLLIASDLRCNAAAECLAIATGNKACGGPSGFVVVSQNNRFFVDGTIEKLALQTSAIDGEYNQLAGRFSDCSYLMAPETDCVASLCQVK